MAVKHTRLFAEGRGIDSIFSINTDNIMWNNFRDRFIFLVEKFHFNEMIPSVMKLRELHKQNPIEWKELGQFNLIVFVALLCNPYMGR